MNEENAQNAASAQNDKSLDEKIETGELSDAELTKLKADVERAELLADLLDDKMLDPIAGLFEGAGDAASALAGLYIIYQAKKLNMPYHKLAIMAGRQAIDLGGGSVPIIGDVFDFVYKSNKQNAAMLRKHFEEIEKRKSEKQLENLKGKI